MNPAWWFQHILANKKICSGTESCSGVFGTISAINPNKHQFYLWTFQRRKIHIIPIFIQPESFVFNPVIAILQFKNLALFFRTVSRINSPSCSDTQEHETQPWPGISLQVCKILTLGPIVTYTRDFPIVHILNSSFVLPYAQGKSFQYWLECVNVIKASSSGCGAWHSLSRNILSQDSFLLPLLRLLKQ